MRSPTRTLAIALVVLLFGSIVWAQEADLAAEIEALKDGQDQIRQELAEIKKMLAAAPRPAPAPAAQRSPVEGKLFDLGDNPVKGASTAKLTLVEFSDYQ